FTLFPYTTLFRSIESDCTGVSIQFCIAFQRDLLHRNCACICFQARLFVQCCLLYMNRSCICTCLHVSTDPLYVDLSRVALNLDIADFWRSNIKSHVSQSTQG